ncbi:MAG: YciI family protein [Rhodospirillales bacterium]
MSDGGPSWNEMVDQCSELGLLAKKLYVVFTSPVNGMRPVMEVLDEHLAYQNKIQNEGIMFGAGPFSDAAEQNWDGDGMIIIRADTMAAAKIIADNDPMHKAGARSYEIRPWLLNEGKVTIDLTFSNKSMEIE